jgi:hypothetical protein
LKHLFVGLLLPAFLSKKVAWFWSSSVVKSQIILF